MATEVTKGHLLVAEDNETNRVLTQKQLNKLGYSCDFALNGEQALKIWQDKPYALILMDCQMPHMDGFEATREIRALEVEGQHKPIIAMTANAMQGDKEKCLAAGMDDYLSKPVSLEALQSVLLKWLSLSEG